MSDLATMKADIADDLERTDLTSQIAALIPRSIEFFADNELWFLQKTNSISLNAGVSSSDVPTGLRNESRNGVRITEGAYQYTLTKRSYEEVQRLTTASVARGIPNSYAYQDGKFFWWPINDIDRTVYVDGIYDEVVLVDGTDSNAWTDQARELIKADVKYRIARDILRDPQRMQTEAIARTEHLRELRSKTNKKVYTGRLKAYM